MSFMLEWWHKKLSSVSKFCRDEFRTGSEMYPMRLLSTLKIEQEVGDDLSVYVLNFLLKVNILPSLVVMGLMMVEIWIFQIVTWTRVGHVIKLPCGFNGGTLSL